MHDNLDVVLWTNNLLKELGYNIEPATIYQDNKSTIMLANKGEGNFKRTKHINVRLFYVKQLIEEGEVKIEYLPTDDMIADLLTKPLVGERFYYRLRAKLLNMTEE